MTNTLLTLLLSFQLTLPTPQTAVPQRLALNPGAQARPAPVWWGLIDPELSAWFARIPQEEKTDAPFLWDWSWRSFFAALFGQTLVKEDVAHAPAV